MAPSPATAESAPSLSTRRFSLVFDSAVAASGGPSDTIPGGQNLLFAGAWTDPLTGLAYHRARWYSARDASFLSPDNLGDVDSPNLYAYCALQPHMARDPEGDIAVVDNLLGGAISVGVGMGVSHLLGQEYTLKDATVDFGLGAFSSGLSSFKYLKYAGEASKLANATRLGGRVAAQVGLGLAAEVTRNEWERKNYTMGQLAAGALFSAGIGEAGDIGAKGVGRLGRWAAARMGQSESGLGHFLARDVRSFRLSSRGAVSAHDLAIMKSIRRHSERLVRKRAFSGDPEIAAQVAMIRHRLHQGRLAAAGSRFHSLMFEYVEEAQSRGLLSSLAREPRVSAPFWSAVAYRKPDFGFGLSTAASTGLWDAFYDIKPWRSGAGAFALSSQFLDIYSRSGLTPTPLYYRIGL